MSYILSRIKAILKHLASLRGTLLSIAFLATVTAILTPSPASAIAGLVAAATSAFLLLLLSVRLSTDHSHLASLQKTERQWKKSIAGRRPAPARSTPRVGPNDNTVREDRVARARAVVAAARSKTAVVAVEAPTSPNGELGVSRSLAKGPAITIIVPCHNNAATIATTLESVRRQSHTDWECIIVDDASSDATVYEVNRYAESDYHFRMARHKVPSGPGATKNTGLRMARGVLVTFLPGDAILMADSLLDRIEALQHMVADTAGSYCGVRRSGSETILDHLPAHEEWTGRRVLDFVSTASWSPIALEAILLRTDVLRNAGGFDEAAPDGAEHWRTWLRILRSGYALLPSRWTTVLSLPTGLDPESAQQKLEAERALIAHAYERDDSIAGQNAPRRFPLPVAHYQRQVAEARIALDHAVVSVLRGAGLPDRDDAASTRPVIEHWMDRHIGFDTTIDAIFRDVLQLDENGLRALSDDLQPMREELGTLIRTDHQENRLAERQQVQYEVVFVPLNAHQAAAMLNAAKRLPGHSESVAFLNVESISGASGLNNLFEETHYPVYSLNRWVLEGLELRSLVVGFPRDGTIEELVAATLANGGRVAELAMDGDDVMRVDESPEHTDGVARVQYAQLASWVTEAGSAPPSVSVVGSPDRALLWHGATEPDPDAAYNVEEYPNTLIDSSEIERFRDIHRGERCVIIGNGPSLNVHDLRKLENEYTIGVNGIFYAADRMGFDLSYYVVEDTMVVRDNLEMIKKYRAGHKFFPSIYRDQIGEDANISYFMMNRGYYAWTSPSFCVPRFSTDASQRVYSGQSVTIINLQLAYYMGFNEVVLIGMDFSYTVPDDAKVEGVLITSMGDDPNHFHPDYFGKGKVWKDPKLDRVLANYQLARLMYEADGRRIINATAGGRLELFDRVPYDELFH